MVEVPDHLERAHCVRCGQLLPLRLSPEADAQVTAAPPIGLQHAIQPESGDRPTAAASLPAGWESWEEFRAGAPSVQRELADLATRALPDLRTADWLPIPHRGAERAAGLGRPIATVEAPGENAAFAIVAGWSLIFAGIAAILFFGIPLLRFPRPLTWQKDLGVFLFGASFAGAGIYFGAWYAHFRRISLPVTLWLYDLGMLWERGQELGTCLWEDVNNFQIRWTDARPLIRLMVRDDFQVVLSPGDSPALMPLAEFIETKATAAQLLPRLRRIFSGEAVRFGKVVLRRDAWNSPGLSASWARLVRVVADQKLVLVELKNQERWYELPLAEVSFPLLLVAIAHVMIEEHERLRI
jgi:hypothetical protein